jgi:hypothetical protein
MFSREKFSLTLKEWWRRSAALLSQRGCAEGPTPPLVEEKAQFLKHVNIFRRP